MKKIIILLIFAMAVSFLSFAESNDNQTKENNEAETSLQNSNTENPEESDKLSVIIPAPKRPEKGDPERIKELNDTDPESAEKNAELLKYGLESDVLELVEKMTRDKDPRFVEEVYDVFEETKSPVLKEKILLLFKVLEDPCLEDYAVSVLNDPYDEKNSIVSACFSYIQVIKTKEALPCVKTLLESDDEQYFLNSLETLGKIGGSEEAEYLSAYLEREDLPLAQRQSLVKVLGELHAAETFDSMVELAENEDENSFIRMYAAEAIGKMEKKEAIPVLVKLFESEDPNLRAHVIKGLSYFEDEEARKTIILAIKDSHQKVRTEAVNAVKKLNISEADEYLIYRAKNDNESNVKNLCYKTLAFLNTQKANDYLLSQITDKKVPDGVKLRVATALLAEDERGAKEIAQLAAETVKDDRRKQLRYGLGKEMAKYKNQEFADVTLMYISNKDVSTIGTGLDMYARGRYSNCDADVKTLAEKADLNARSKNAMAIKAAKLLGMDVEKMTEQKDKEREAEEALKAAKKGKPVSKKNQTTEKNETKTPVDAK